MHSVVLFARPSIHYNTHSLLGMSLLHSSDADGSSLIPASLRSRWRMVLCGYQRDVEDAKDCGRHTYVEYDTCCQCTIERLSCDGFLLAKLLFGGGWWCWTLDQRWNCNVAISTCGRQTSLQNFCFGKRRKVIYVQSYEDMRKFEV